MEQAQQTTLNELGRLSPQVLNALLGVLVPSEAKELAEILEIEENQHLWDLMGRRDASFEAGPLLWLTKFTQTEDQHWMAKGTPAVAPFPTKSYSICGDAIPAFGAHAIHSQEPGNDDLMVGLRIHQLDVPMAPAYVLGDADRQGRQGSVAGELLPDPLAATAGVDAKALPVSCRQYHRVGLRKRLTNYRRSKRREPGPAVSPLWVRVRRSRLSTRVQRVFQRSASGSKANHRCFVR